MASTEGYVTSPGSRSSEGDRRSSDEIRRSIERQRDDLDVTAEALERKLAPRELAEHLWHDMRTRVSSGADDVVGMVKRHPVPIGLIGAGIAWWIYESSSGRGFRFGNGADRYEDDSLGVGSTSTGSYPSRSGYGSRDYSSRGYASSGYAGEGEGAYAESGRNWRQRSIDAAHRSGERLRSGAMHARQGFSDAVDKNPLALGAACFSLGLLAAIAVPSSRWENETMGETRDRVTRRARRAAKRAAVDAAEQGARAAQDAAERIHDEAQRSPSEYEARKRSEHEREDWRSEPGSSGGYRGSSSSVSSSRPSGGATSGGGASSGSWSSGAGSTATGKGKSGSESDAPDPWDPNRSSRE